LTLIGFCIIFGFAKTRLVAQSIVPLVHIIMNCENCGVNLEENQVTVYKGKTLCEDCCFDMMSPTKVCDPIAVHSTLSVRKQSGQKGTDGLTDLQKQIYNTVIQRGNVDREILMREFGMSLEEFTKQFAVLRHCELLGAFKQGGKIYLTKFKA
jgi:hypothetical protein